MKIIVVFVAGFFLGAVALSPAPAEDASHKQIIDALKPKVKTRGVGSASGGLSASEKEFISGLRVKTRAITVVEREELAIIVKEKKLPAIDLEIYFDYDSADISPKAKPGLIELGVALRSDELKGALFLVSRHIDATGSDGYNCWCLPKISSAVRNAAAIVVSVGLPAFDCASTALPTT